MSFNYNAYTHLELAQNADGKWTWVCEGCGGDGERSKFTAVIDETEPLDTLIHSFHDHISDSHKRTPDDFEGWPNGL
jgi:hypothetical protein